MPVSPLKKRLFYWTASRAIDAVLALNVVDDISLSPLKTPLGFLARIRMWLRLIWGGGVVATKSVLAVPVVAANRAEARIYGRKMPLARREDPLALVFYRRVGRARFLRYIYDGSLTGRVRWCFTRWNWKWKKRICFKLIAPTSPKKRDALSRSFAPLIALFPD
jgi:hypothetical protein